jgi:NADPH-dependent F420 reductase
MTDHEAPDASRLAVGILGGTGHQGRGLARRFALAGNQVTIGSRSAERAQAAAAQIRQETGPNVRGLANRDTARSADVVISAVPWEGHGDLLSGLAPELAGKILVDCVNPMGFDTHGAYPLPVAEGSAAQQAAALLPGSTVVAAFHHVSAVLLLDPRSTASTWTCSCSVTAGRPPTWCRRWRPGSRRARRLHRPAAQLRTDRSACRQPGLHQPPLQGARRAAHHRYLSAGGRPARGDHQGRRGGSWSSSRTPATDPASVQTAAASDRYETARPFDNLSSMPHT